MTGTISGAGSAHLSGTPEFTPARVWFVSLAWFVLSFMIFERRLYIRVVHQY